MISTKKSHKNETKMTETTLQRHTIYYKTKMAETKSQKHKTIHSTIQYIDSYKSLHNTLTKNHIKTNKIPLIIKLKLKLIIQ